MKRTDEDKSYILNEYLRNIFHISNKHYQKRVWLDAKGPECDDYTESICHFFDDGDPIIDNYTIYNIRDEQYLVLLKFRESLDIFHSITRFRLGPDFLQSKEWTRITEMAQEVLDLFDYKKPV